MVIREKKGFICISNIIFYSSLPFTMTQTCSNPAQLSACPCGSQDTDLISYTHPTFLSRIIGKASHTLITCSAQPTPPVNAGVITTCALISWDSTCPSQSSVGPRGAATSMGNTGVPLLSLYKSLSLLRPPDRLVPSHGSPEVGHS